MKRDTLPESSAASINFIQRKVSVVRSISNERSSREENQEKDREVRLSVLVVDIVYTLLQTPS